ncbi:nickel-binding protein [Parahaliea maris]|nr:nickel-binding protein [Parahaliea maris]
MTDVVLEREFDKAMSTGGFAEMAHEVVGCLPLYRVEWQESLLAEDGSRLVCRFVAPDTESVRMISRDYPARNRTAWAGAVHDTGRTEAVAVVVERRFDSEADLDALQAQEDAHAWCLEQHRVTFLRTFLSGDGKRMLCLYHAPDAESVRLAQQQAGMPVERVWACRGFSPANFPGE